MEKDKWISVNNQRPNDKQYVIVTNGKQVIMAQFYEFSQSFVLNDKNLLVTHWQPLPEPPKTT